MALQVYKQGQGYWTRLMSAIGGGTIVLMGAAWLWDQLGALRLESNTIYVQAGVSVAIVALFGWLIFRIVYGRQKSGDFLIATEGEMKKVNWSTRKEIVGSTWVVIGLTFFIAVLIAILDGAFSQFFRLVNVLQG